jgi:hypothetical protein
MVAAKTRSRISGLCQRYRRMMVRDKLKQVVVTAIARELAGFVWPSPASHRIPAPRRPNRMC